LGVVGDFDNYTIVKTFRDGQSSGGYYNMPFVSAASWRRWLRDTLFEETGLKPNTIRTFHKNLRKICKDEEVEELLKIANGCLPRVRLEHDRLNAKLNSLKAETGNTARTYQHFVDRNMALKKREGISTSNPRNSDNIAE
jgi:hypothetical protein